MIGGKGVDLKLKCKKILLNHKVVLGVIAILVVIIVVLFVLILMNAWKENHIWDYYHTEGCFLSSTGVVTYIYHDEIDEEIYLSLSDIDPRFHYRGFRIVGKNYKIVMENGLLDNLSVGDSVEFVGSPRVFWDGYVLPMIEISVNGEQFLEAEQGYGNFIEWLRSNL